MGKYVSGKLKRWEKLSRGGQVNLLYDLLFAFTLVKNLPDAADFITDLLTRSEIRILSKRLGIAKLLLDDCRYQEIAEILKVSPSTIAKVAAWLAEKGVGFRKIIRQIPERQKRKNFYERSKWDKFKRSHPAAFWPELLIEDLQENSIKKRETKLKKTLEDLESKDVIHHRLDEAYREIFRQK